MTRDDEQGKQQRRHVAEVVRYWMRRRGLTRPLCPDDLEIEAVRSALRRYDAITNVFRPNGDVLPAPDLGQLERRVRHGWMAFQASNYQAIGLLLPDLIREAQAAVWQLDGDDARTAKAWLAWTYQLTAATAFKLGDVQLGWVAADRGIQLAEQTEDPTLVGCAVLLKGSIAAARLQQAADVRDLQADALSVATRLGTDRNEHWSAFGTTNVLVHQVSALADMHSGGRVIEAAEQIAARDLARLPRERRASHLLDVARGYVQWGRRDEASTALLDADQLAPEEVRCRQMTRQLIADLVRSYPPGSSSPVALRSVARAVGVAV